LVEDTAPTGNLEAIEYYLRFQYIPTPHTIYREVLKLPPASYITFDFEGRTRGPVRYWDLRFAPETGLTEQDWQERGESVIRESVKAHLVAYVPFGVFLSGGVDSSLIALEMSRLLERPVKAFSIGFLESEYSELHYAQIAAQHSGVELLSEYVGADALN